MEQSGTVLIVPLFLCLSLSKTTIYEKVDLEKESTYRETHTMNKKNKTLNELYSEYLNWLKAHGYSIRTWEVRKTYLGHFVEWCEPQELTQPNQITRDDLERYQSWVYEQRRSNGKKLTFATQRNRLVPLKAFFRWLVNRGQLEANYAADLQMPKVERRLPKAILSEEEAEQIIRQPDINTRDGLRDRVMLEVFYSTGIRRNELARLRLNDVDLESSTLWVRQGKGRKDRMLPMSDRSVTWIKRYLKDSKVHDRSDSILFFNDDGKAWDPPQLSILVGDYVKQSRIKKEGSCHLFRHTLATRMLENGADLRYVQQMLGHADISTTQIYTRVTMRRLREVYNQTCPGR